MSFLCRPRAWTLFVLTLIAALPTAAMAADQTGKSRSYRRVYSMNRHLAPANPRDVRSPYRTRYTLQPRPYTIYALRPYSYSYSYYHRYYRPWSSFAPGYWTYRPLSAYGRSGDYGSRLRD